jgi:hypothetical protein
MRRSILLRVLLVLAAGMAACATPPEPDPETATVWGYVRLAPKKDLPGAGGGYGDRRLADVKRFDYSHPRHAIVFTTGRASVSSPPPVVAIREETGRLALDPPFASASRSQGLTIRNETAEPRIVSVPAVGWLRRIDAGGSARLDPDREGELTLHLLGGPASATPPTARIWIAEGLIAEVDASGRYVLGGLPPGAVELRAWHPRLPPTRAFALELSRGDVERLDLEIGVDASDLGDTEGGER